LHHLIKTVDERDVIYSLCEDITTNVQVSQN